MSEEMKNESIVLEKYQALLKSFAEFQEVAVPFGWFNSSLSLLVRDFRFLKVLVETFMHKE